MENFGRFSWDPERFPFPEEAERNNCRAAEADREAWLTALTDAAQRYGGWVAVGAERMLVSVVGGGFRHPAYDAVMFAALSFLRDTGAVKSRLTSDERDWWRRHQELCRPL